MTFMEVILIILIFSGTATLIRTIAGPSIWDRVLGLNLLSSKVIMAIVIFAYINQRSYLLDVAIIYALFGFIGTIMISRFIEKQGDI